MATYTSAVVFGWIESTPDLLAEKCLKLPHSRKLLRGTSKIINDKGTDVIYGYPCRIKGNKLIIDKETRREIAELFEKWRDNKQQNEIILGYYPVILGDINWDKYIYFI